MNTSNNNTQKVFVPDFLAQMKTHLDENTQDDQCITRPDLAMKLGISFDMEQVLTLIVKCGLIPGYKVWMGPGGGFGKVNRKSTKRERDPKAYSTLEVSDELAAEILNKLEKACAGGAVVTSKTIARDMARSSITFSKMKTLISAALKRPEFNEFATKAGRGGGIFKASIRPDLAQHKQPASTVTAKLKSEIVKDLSEAGKEAEEDPSAPLPQAANTRNYPPEMTLQQRWLANQNSDAV